MYVSDDPRAKLQSASSTPGAAEIGGTSTGFAPAQYALFSATAPRESSDTAQTWYARGQNFVVAYTEARPGARLERLEQPDEYMLLIPEQSPHVSVQTAGDTVDVPGYALVIIPPGRSTISVHGAGTVIRIFSAASPDLNALTSNAKAYTEPHPHIPPYKLWPPPPAGYRVRAYSLDVPPQPGRFGRIWRCTTLMINVHPLEPGPRDPARMSPHHHADFEQGSLALKGSFTHHVRWPWTTNIRDWRDDDHKVCPAPSLAVIPPPAIHTSAGTDPVLNHLVDIFSPPRLDFSIMEGWVLNAQEYPMPAECAPQ